MKLTENGWKSDNFSVKELACSCCGVNKIDPKALEMLQELRKNRGKGVVLTSAYRCANHPAEIKKSTVGRHEQGIAFDIKCHPRDIAELVSLAYKAGFRGFGYAKSFLHIDSRQSSAGWMYS